MRRERRGEPEQPVCTAPDVPPTTSNREHAEKRGKLRSCSKGGRGEGEVRGEGEGGGEGVAGADRGQRERGEGEGRKG